MISLNEMDAVIYSQAQGNSTEHDRQEVQRHIYKVHCSKGSQDSDEDRDHDKNCGYWVPENEEKNYHYG
jgi:hypothetical protein